MTQTAQERFREVIELDRRSLAAFRIALGGALIIDLLCRAGDIQAFYTDAGVLPRETWLSIAEPWWFSFHLATGTVLGQALLFSFAGIAAAALAAGYRWRIAACVSYVLFLSLNHRNPYVTDFGDQTLQMLLLWAPFLPLDAFSLSGSALRGERVRVGSAATAAYLAQLLLVYGSAACHKVRSPAWVHGTVLPAILSYEPDARPLGRMLAGHPALCAGLAYATLGVELGVPLLLFWPVRSDRLRAFVVATFFGLHIAFGACLRLGIFPLISLVSWLPIVPSAIWDRLSLRWAGSGPAPQLPRAAAITALVLLGLVESWTALTFSPGNRLVAELKPPLKALGLAQTWSMFNGRPENDGHLSVPALLRSGARVDLLTGRPVTASGGAVAFDDVDQRWTNYLVVLSDPAQELLLSPWLEYLCRAWNSSHADHAGGLEVDFTPEGASKPQVRLRGTCVEH